MFKNLFKKLFNNEEENDNQYLLIYEDEYYKIFKDKNNNLFDEKKKLLKVQEIGETKNLQEIGETKNLTEFLSTDASTNKNYIYNKKMNKIIYSFYQLGNTITTYNFDKYILISGFDNHCIIINNKGDTLINTFCNEIIYSRIMNIFIIKYNKTKFKILDLINNMIFDQKDFEFIYLKGNRILVADLNNNKGLIDRQGLIKIDMKYKRIEFVYKKDQRYYYICKSWDNTYSLIDQDNKIYLHDCYDIRPFCKNLIVVIKSNSLLQDNDKFMVNLNTMNKLPCFQQVLFIYDTALIYNDKYKFADPITLEKSLSSEYDSIEVIQPSGQLARAVKNNKQYCVSIIDDGKEYEFKKVVTKIGDKEINLYYTFIDKEMIISNDCFVGNIIEFKDSLKNIYDEDNQEYIDYMKELNKLELFLKL